MIIGKNKAFLLVEVLVTVVVVSASIIFINHAFTSSLQATSMSNDYFKAVLLLEDKTFDIELDPYAFEEDSSFTGEDEFMGMNFYWEEMASPLEKTDFTDEEEEKEIGLRRLEASLGWKRHDTEKEIGVLTYIPAKESQEE